MSGKTARKKRQGNDKRQGNPFSQFNDPTVIAFLSNDLNRGTAVKGANEELLDVCSNAFEAAMEFYKTDNLAIALIPTPDGYTEAYLGAVKDGGGYGSLTFTQVFGTTKKLGEGSEFKRYVAEAGGVVYVAMYGKHGEATTALCITHRYILNNRQQIMRHAAAHGGIRERNGVFKAA